MERVPRVTGDHVAEDFFGHDVHDATGCLLLVDGERLAAGGFGHDKRRHAQSIAAQRDIDSERCARRDDDIARDLIESHVIHRDCA